jgi:peptide chain release factor 1
MIEKLIAIEELYEQIEAQLALPEVYTDPAKVAKLSRKQKELSKIIEVFRRYRKRMADAEEARSLLDTALEADFREMVQEELNVAGGYGAAGIGA